MKYPELAKVLSSSVEDSIKLFIEKLSSQRGLKEGVEQLASILDDFSVASLTPDHHPRETAERFYDLGREDPSSPVTVIHHFENDTWYFIKISDLQDLLNTLTKEFPEVPEITRFSRKLIKEGKIRKKGIE